MTALITNITTFKLHRLVLAIGIAAVLATKMFGALAGTNDTDIFRDKNGEAMRFKDIVTCTFPRPSPDGAAVMFWPSNRGNLFEVPKDGSTGGQTIYYKRSGTSEKGFYRVYHASETVSIAVHRDKPLVILIFNKEQFDGFCDKLIPQFMSE
jgi:hypothetical protein